MKKQNKKDNKYHHFLLAVAPFKNCLDEVVDVKLFIQVFMLATPEKCTNTMAENLKESCLNSIFQV